jgi:hypothetical protein
MIKLARSLGALVPMPALGMAAIAVHLLHPWTYTFMHSTTTSLVVVQHLAFLDTLTHVGP